MGVLDTLEVTSGGSFGTGNASIAARSDSRARQYHGFSCYVSSGNGIFSVYNGTDNTGTLVEKVYVAGAASSTSIRESGIKCGNGIFIEHNSGTIDNLSIFYQ